MAIEAFSALAHSSRLTIFRLLVKIEPEGMPVGDISRALDILPSTLSGHLAILRRAGLVKPTRKQREIYYRADLAEMGQLVHFMLDDCCNGDQKACNPIAELLHQA